MASSRGPGRRTRPSSSQQQSHPVPVHHQISSPGPSSRSALPSSNRTAHGRLLPDVETLNAGKLARLQAFFRRFCDDELKIEDADAAHYYLRAILRHWGEAGITEQCITDICTSTHGLFAISTALSFNLNDRDWLNDYAGQFFLLIGHRYKASERSLDPSSYDDMVRRLMGHLVEENSDLIKTMAEALRKDKLKPSVVEGFAWFLKEYLEFSTDPPPYIDEIIEDAAVLEKFYKSDVAEIRLIGHKIKYWVDCGGVIRDHGGPVPGGRHDNDFDDFRKINIVPTPDEVHSTERPFLVKSKDALRQPGLSRMGAHLDCQFRLLREEMLNEVRSDYHEYIKGKKVGLTSNHNVERSKVILAGLQWGGWDFECCIKYRKFGIRLILPEGFGKFVNFHGLSYNQLLQEDPNFPYKNNSMSCLIVKDEIAGFPTLTRDLECLREEPPCIILTFEGKKAIEFAMAKIWWSVIHDGGEDPHIKLICVDTPVFAHEPVLKRLQQMKSIPLSEELVFYKKGNPIGRTSFAPQQPIKHIAPETPLRDLVKSDRMMVMDKAQCKAIVNSLQHRVSLIQGPPGTGKTLVGNILAKLFLLYTQESILVITHQNHICDEFIENLLDMGVRQNDIVRLGSQFSRRTRCVSINEISDEKDILNSAKDVLQGVHEHLQCAWLLIEESFKETFGHPMLLKDILAIAKCYNEPDLKNPLDRFGYISGLTVPKQWIRLVQERDPDATVPDDVQLFRMWAENMECPPAMRHFMTEKGRKLWELPAKRRATLLGWWKEATMLDQIYGLADSATTYNKILDEVNRWKATRVRDILKKKRVIAATTNGAAKYLSQIADAGPKILIVEEAAQILESHVLAALHPGIEQIIMIGDHKQLRPRCDTFELQHDSRAGFDLDISLFERLMLSHFPYNVLEIQHRARPEIANIIRTLTYPNLKDAPSVRRYGDIRGLQQNLIWMHQMNQESSAQGISTRSSLAFKKSSKINLFEAEMIVSIVRYLGGQGYSSDDIAIITPYLGQVALISKLIRQKSQFDVILSQMDYHELVRAGLMEQRDASGITKYVEVCTVDQFQGSDRDIIIVSMVRCNEDHKIGFLKSLERTNVLLSRARKGLIIIGDLYTVCARPDVNGTAWPDVMHLLGEQGCLLDGIPIVCQRHPGQKYLCETPQQLDHMSPEGGCRIPCNTPLSCGKHKCPFYCHSCPDHGSMECTVAVKKTCSKGHEWEAYCWSPHPKPCQKCSRIDAHFQARKEEEAAAKTREYEESLEAERKLKQLADEIKQQDLLEGERQKALEKATTERLVAQGKQEPPEPPKRRKPWVRPFGDKRVDAMIAAERAKEVEERKAREALEKASSSATSSTSQAGIQRKKTPQPLDLAKYGARPLFIGDLKLRRAATAADSSSSSSTSPNKNDTNNPPQQISPEGSGEQSPTKASKVLPPLPDSTDLQEPASSITSAVAFKKAPEITTVAPEQSQDTEPPKMPAIETLEVETKLGSAAIADDKAADHEVSFAIEPTINMDDEFEHGSSGHGEIADVEEAGSMGEEEHVPTHFPSSPPVRRTLPVSCNEDADEDIEPPTPVQEVKEVKLEVQIEEVSEVAAQSIPHTVPDSAATIEEPSTFIEPVTNAEEITAIVETGVPDITEGDINLSIIITETVNSQTPVKHAPDSTDIVDSESLNNVEPEKSDTPTSGAFPSDAEFAQPFPSASRDEWHRQKQISKDSNIALDQIMDMIGMEHVKEQVLAIKAKAETVHRQGIDLGDERFHIALLGNPGTGKTTFARLYAKFLRSEGVLEATSYFETTGAKLANGGISGIEDLFAQLVAAKGGTLFIDEAYQLVTTGAFEGRQVLDFLLSEMEKNLGKIVVIISGYNKEMEKFFEHNPGLNSRIPYRVQFEDFTNEELLYILQDTLKRKFKDRMKVEGGYNGLYLRIVSKRLGRTRGIPGCGNARSVQNTVAKILERQAARLTRERKDDVSADDFYLTKEDIIGPAPTKAAMETPAWKQLHQLIGLSAVKESVSILLKRMERNYQRELAEEQPIDISLNRVFLGSPGTGKTSVAKIYGKILAQLGLLSSGEVIMKTPADFVGRALGESEANTKAILNSARGKVLIVDEAYMLTPKLSGAEDPYKAAVIDTIVSEVQNVPGDDQCVLLLGYKEDLEKMFNVANPGLSRRFPISDGFVFKDFTDAELLSILDLKLRLAELKASSEAREVAIQKISQKRQKPNFGNAGEVENLLNVAKERMLKRQLESDDPVTELLTTDFDPDHDRGNPANTDLRELFKDLIGVDDVYQRFEDYQTTSIIMRRRGLDPKDHTPMLFIFKGPPGTGKTTTARKMGQIFYNMGFLASNEVVECSASDLTAEFLGQTAQKTRKKLESALGKVLFIDEAYRLLDNQYGAEASNELVDAVTKPQYMGKLVVILAGYDEGMDRLLAMNVGLASRFAEVIDFPDVNYTTAIEILKVEVTKAEILIPSLNNKEAREYREVELHMQEIAKTPGWGHARDALTLAKNMVAAAFRGIKNLNDPICVTHGMAIKALTDMLKQRRGRAFQMPALPPTPKLPSSSGTFPRVMYKENILEATPMANINTQTQDIYKAREANGHGNETLEGAAHRRLLDDEVPRLSQTVNAREPGTTDANWKMLLHYQELEQDLHDTGMAERELARRRLQESQKSLQDATLAVTKMEAKSVYERRQIEDFDQALKDVQEQEEIARNKVAAREQRLETMIQNEKLTAAREKINLVKLEKMRRCPKGYQWIKTGDGYRCGGGEHFVSHEELAAFKMPL
ncbi:hypothetical protein Dda_2481 [Drechslerella dactyloides]|uniref:AAA+ ATPase domain-containing protein n=1 Tax=Drechslerella dactyloides TaxID=74499 RepID=A0AAD6NLZ4_DREDA|nr:hypothetical protein Dda_2481 [Drechslerella dactyloides]